MKTDVYRLEKQNKRFMIWAAGLVFLLLILLAPKQVYAAVTEDLVEFDFEHEYIYVRQPAATLYYCIIQEGKPTDKLKMVPVSERAVVVREWQGVLWNHFVIDISSLNTTKPMVLCLKATEDDTEICTVSIPAQKKLEVKYVGKDDEKGTLAAMYADVPGVNGETGYFTFKADNKDVTDLSKVLWKAGDGTNFKEMSELDLEFYRYGGATIYFTYSDGECPLSKVVKVKVKKQGNEPKIKVDGAKQTIAIKRGMQYRVTTEGKTTAWQTAPEDAAFLRISELEGLVGDGLYTPFEEAVVEVRTAATEKAQSSKAATVYLDTVGLPVLGQDGISVSYTKGADDTNGLTITNGSKVEYQVAVVEKYSWESEGVTDLISKIDNTAKKGKAGYVNWKKVAAGKSVKIAYNEYKDCEEGYLILARIATVKENTKTAEREFRVASVVRPVGGIVPVACGYLSGSYTKPGTYILTESAQMRFEFNGEPGFKLFTAVGDSEFAENADRLVEFEATPDSTFIIKAYFVEETTGEKQPVKTFTYRFVSGGELDDYKNAYRYNYFIKLDEELGKGNNYQLLYQRLYLACITYEETVSISDLKLDPAIMIQVYSSLSDDNPELIQIEGGYSYTSSYIHLNLRDRSFCNRLLEECEASLEEIKVRILEKYGSLGNASRLEKVKEIHDYLVLKKQYKNSEMAQTMAGALAENYTPVCMSYTLAMKWCCNKLGIQCEIKYGNIKKERHAWNIINYGEPVDYSDPDAVYNTDDWYEMDVTWDDPVGGSEDYISYKYFNVTTEFIDTTRTRSTGGFHDGPVKECTGTEYSWDKIKNDF